MIVSSRRVQVSILTIRKVVERKIIIVFTGTEVTAISLGQMDGIR